MSVSISVHLEDDKINVSRVMYVEPISGTFTAAVEVDGAMIYFRSAAQIRQMIDTLQDAERRLFALEHPQMQEKAVQVDDAPDMDYSREDAILRDEEEAEAEHANNLGLCEADFR